MNRCLLALALLSSMFALAQKPQKLTDKVDVFLGTGGHGHVYPGATVPFGMIQLSPDNGNQGWDWCSGYHYSSDSIAGFSHTHLSGTGIGDWCDISVMPYLGDARNTRASFSHTNESGRPGYYSVKLDNGIQCEMTASERAGFHRYNFPGKTGWLQFDMGFQINWDSATDAFVHLLNDSTLIGYRFSTGWAKNQRVFFAARFSTKVFAFRLVAGNAPPGEMDPSGNNKASSLKAANAKALLQFNTNDKPLVVKVAISSVSSQQALHALQPLKSVSFDRIRMQADQSWEKELSKIRINASKEFETKFYTALYRTCLAPVTYSDANGMYRNQDNTVHTTSGKKYTVFSLWDTFRALHPLFTITQTERLPDMLNSMMLFQKDNGLLPVWDLSTWETNTMTGYHSIPVLADAILKGVKGINVNEAYAAMLKSAFQKQRGTPEYIRYGYLPQDKHGWSVTITLEYAFDDWCIAQVAKKLGKTKDYEQFLRRSMSYQRLFDRSTGFMRARDTTGKFIEPFDPLLSEHGFEGQYIEGTAWQHSFFVPHDVNGLATLHGGKAKLVQKLDTMFSTTSELHGSNVSMDVTGLIGQYAHGNEPSHHIIYMYSWLGYPDKAAEQLQRVVDSMYKSGPDGLIGNDDCGQMSAWLVWTSLGMYPMNPVGGEYVFGFPLVRSATIQLPSQKKLLIASHVAPGTKGTRIKKILLNGRQLSRSVQHTELLKGGKLEYFLAD